MLPFCDVKISKIRYQDSAKVIKLSKWFIDQLSIWKENYKITILFPGPDNRQYWYFYKELKEFIKEKKIQRQIIIVTHNANLVVPTDSENIIIANQNGQDNSKDNEKYRFAYITGSLENSFMNPGAIGILNKMGVKEHVCDILECGREPKHLRKENKNTIWLNLTF